MALPALQRDNLSIPMVGASLFIGVKLRPRLSRHALHREQGRQRHRRQQTVLIDSTGETVPTRLKQAAE